MALLEFCRKASTKLSNEIPKTMEKCEDLYKKIHQFHEKYQDPSVPKITDVTIKDQHMAHLEDKLQEDIQCIQKTKVFNQEDFNLWVGKSFVNVYILEDMCRAAS